MSGLASKVKVKSNSSNEATAAALKCPKVEFIEQIIPGCLFLTVFLINCVRVSSRILLHCKREPRKGGIRDVMEWIPKGLPNIHAPVPVCGKNGFDRCKIDVPSLCVAFAARRRESPLDQPCNMTSS